MKLKKIASLMLAGIMAVSMLAACGEGKKDDSSSSSSEVPATSNVAEYANYMLSGPEKDIFTFSDSNTLLTALKKNAEDVDKFTDANVEATYDFASVVTYSDGTNNAIEGVGDGMVKELDARNVVTDFSNVPSKAGNRVVVKVYGVSGKVNEEDAVKSAVNTFIGTGVSGTNYPAAQTGYNCDYAAEISAVKVASRQHPAKSAWVIAIVVTQTATVAA